MAEQYMYSTLYMLLESSYLTTITAYTCTVPLKTFEGQLEPSTPSGVGG